MFRCLTYSAERHLRSKQETHSQGPLPLADLNQSESTLVPQQDMKPQGMRQRKKEKKFKVQAIITGAFVSIAQTPNTFLLDSLSIC